MKPHQIEPVHSTKEKTARLKADLQKARQDLMEAEAELAQEQAAVNAFRMHCRLKLDALVDSYLELRAQKQAYITHLALIKQGVDPETLNEEEDFLGEIEDPASPPFPEGELILPTPTPRDKAAEKRLYRELARRFHPDLAATVVERSYRTSMMAAVNNAYAAGDMKALYDLAVELDPNEVSEIAAIEDLESRRLQEMIFKMRVQCRKAYHQLTLLRQENTARLWAKAKVQEERDEDWWSLVQRELEQAITRLNSEILDLQSQIAAFVDFSADDIDEHDRRRL